MSSRFASLLAVTAAALLAACSPQATREKVGKGLDDPKALLAAVDRVTDKQMAGITIHVNDSLFGASQLGPSGLGDAPYKIDVVTSNNSADYLAMIMSGRADLVVFSDGLFTGMIAANAPIRIVHAMQRPRRVCGIAVPANSTARTIRDLKGRTIANTTGYSSETVAIRSFRKAGMDFFKDAKVVTMKSASDGRVGFASGNVDAWAGCAEIFNTEIISGRARSIVTGEDGSWAGQNYWGVHTDLLYDPVRLAAVLDYIKRVDKSIAWANRPENMPAHARELTRIFHSNPRDQLRFLQWAGPSSPLPVTPDVVRGLQLAYDDQAALNRVPPRKVDGFFTTVFNPYFAGSPAENAPAAKDAPAP